MSSACILIRCNRAVFINPLIDQAGILALLDGFVDELKKVLVALRDCNSERPQETPRHTEPDLDLR